MYVPCLYGLQCATGGVQVVPLELLGICPLNRGRLGVSAYHVHEVARPGLLAARYGAHGHVHDVLRHVPRRHRDV